MDRHTEQDVKQGLDRHVNPPDWREEYSGTSHSSMLDNGLKLLADGLRYALGLALGSLAAIAAALMGGTAGGLAAQGLSGVYQSIAAFPNDQPTTVSLRTAMHNVVTIASVSCAVFCATLLFCVVALRWFPYRNPIQSIVLLELTALPLLLVIAGDMMGTDDYGSLVIGFSGLLALALLVLKRPHWVFLSNRAGARVERS